MARGARGALIGVIAVVAMFVAGCGGSSGDSTEMVTNTTEASTSGTPGPNASTGLTMPEFIAAADAICVEENARIKVYTDAISTEGEGTGSQEDLDALADDFRGEADDIERGLARLRALPPPPGKVAAIEAMLDLAASQAVLSESVADAVTAGDSAKVDSLAEQAKLNQAKYRGLAQGLGFQQCGTG